METAKNIKSKYPPPAFESIWSGKRVELPAMLDAREYRAMRQQDLLERYQKPLLCFTMNIAGPIKNNELIRRGFDIGVDDFCQQLSRTKKKILFQAVLHEETGNEAYFVVDIDPFQLKKLTCELEDWDELGRLYDMDILYPGDSPSEIRKIDRTEIGGSPRKCLICGAPGKDCSSRRLHSVAELQRKSAEILYQTVMKREAMQIAEYAVRALLYEVSTTPKPGLVDRNNSGSHKDMDFYSFLNSSASLWPYFESCARIGQQTANEEAPLTFGCLREEGKLAENHMLRATGGINTHKGAIFSMGIAAAAAGRLSAKSLVGNTNPASQEGKKEGTSGRTDPQAILAECAKMTAGLVAEDFKEVTEESAKTAGELLYIRYGITGIRGQMEAGLPAVSQYGLPLLKKLLAEGKSKDEAGAAVLMNIIAHTIDTNLIHRSCIKRQQEAAQEAGELLDKAEADKLSFPFIPELEQLDRKYIRENLSPGGSADLLAVCWFLFFIDTGDGVS